MEIKNIETGEGGKPVKMDGKKVLYCFTLNVNDHSHLTLALAQRLRVPYAFAICEDKESVTGVAVYGRYSNKWYRVHNYHEYVIAHLVKVFANVN